MASDTVETYARVLFDLATAADAVDAVDEDLKSVDKAVRAHVDLRDALTDTSVPVEKKRDVLRDIFGGEVSPEVLSIVTLLVERNALEQLPVVAAAYGEIAERERGIVVAEVVTAVELTDALRASLTDKLNSAVGRPVTLRERVDGSILGGIVIKVAGRVLDGSVSGQLSDLRQALSNATTGGEA